MNSRNDGIGTARLTWRLGILQPRFTEPQKRSVSFGNLRVRKLYTWYVHDITFQVEDIIWGDSETEDRKTCSKYLRRMLAARWVHAW